MNKFKTFGLAAFISIIVIVIIGSCFLYYFKEEDNGCNVMEIKLHGDLNIDFEANGEGEVISRDIVSQIEEAEQNDNIKAIISSINSNGGSGVAAEEVAIALKNAKKPTVALIRDFSKSAGYLAATGADKIFASKYSEVGSIGITASYMENTKYNAKEGFVFNELTSAKYKDMGNPDKPLTADERKLVMRDIMILHEEFVKDVATNRNLDIEKVKLLADGSTMMGQMAKDNGLIDEISGIEDVKLYIQKTINETPVICEKIEY